MISYKGNMLLSFKLTHGPGVKGTKVWVKVDPMVEQFVKSLGDGTYKELPAGLGIMGPLTEDKLEYCSWGNGEFAVPPLSGYTLDGIRHGLIMDGDQVNLSFLRFKGISEGLYFGLRTLYSFSAMKDIKHKVSQAYREFCRDYIVPSSVRVIIVGSPNGDFGD